MTEAIEVQAETMPVKRSAGEVTSLVQLAIDKEVPVEILERLVALKERVEERDARAAYFEALARFQQLVGNIPKTKTANVTTNNGGQFSYKYAPLDEICEYIRPHETACGFSHTWDVDLHPTGSALVIGCTLRHIDGHAERSTFPAPIDKRDNRSMSDAQKNGSAVTFGKRYSMLGVMGLATADEDVDGAKVDGQMRSKEVITAEQAANLSDMIEARGVELRRFLKYFQIEKVGDLPASEHKRAVDLLNQRAAQ